MKKITSILSIMALTAVFSTGALAQAPASATSANTTTTIVAPIAISTTTPLNFGSFATLSTGGTLALSPLGFRTATGGVKLTAATGSPTAAAFAVSGEGSYAYTITLPTTTLTLTTAVTGAGTKTMVVGTFESSIGTAGTLTGGSQNFTVGALLTVGSAQAVGTYINATGFDVTVNYN
jgi:mannose/fructose/N-acetylgalactosamine-specific phosphotransferase system component IIC